MMGAPPRGEATIVGVGARCATGLTALQVAMTVRAGKSQPRESHLVDRAGEPIAVCRLGSIGDDLLGEARHVALAAPALAEALRPWTAAQRDPTLPLVLAVPEALSRRDGEALLAALASGAGASIDLPRSKLVAQGRAGGVAALELAVARLARGEDEAIVVGGVDSYFDPYRLEELDRARRLNGPACENGFIPGEAAAFVTLSRRRRTGVRACGQILGVATEREPRPLGSDEPTHGLGMTLAVKRATAALGRTPIDWALTDVVGERHRVEEWLYVTGRLHARFTGAPRHDQPLLKTGDLGAASATTLLALACVGWETGSAPSPRALIAAHSDGPERGALLVAMESAS